MLISKTNHQARPQKNSHKKASPVPSLSVAVIVPCFNSEDVLQRTLSALFAQTSPPEEIIVVDDGSTDRSIDIAKQFPAPLKVIQQINAGAARARHNGVLHSKSDVVIFNDAGDISLPHRIEEHRSALQSNPECVAAIALSIERGKPAPTSSKITNQPIQGQVTILNDPFSKILSQTFPLTSGMNISIHRDIALQSTNIDRFYKAGNDYALQAKTATAGAFAYIHSISLEYEILDKGLTAKHGWMQQMGYALCAAIETYESLPSPSRDHWEVLSERVKRDWTGIALFAYINRRWSLLKRIMLIGFKYGEPITTTRRFSWALIKAMEAGALKRAPLLRAIAKVILFLK